MAGKQRAMYLAAVSALAAVLAGCGAEPPGKVTDSGKQLSIGGTNSNGSPTQTVPDQQAFLRQLMSDISVARAKTTSISCTLVGYFIDPNSGAPGSNQTQFSFERPNKVAMTIQQSSDARTVGTKLVWTGGSQLAVHTKFIGFWLNTSVDVHDPRATDQRGFFVDETDVTRMMDTLLDPSNQTKLLGIGNLDGVPVAQVQVKSSKSLHGIDHEIFVVDGYKKLPVVREMYDASNKLVWRLHMQNMQLNQSFPASTFKL